jgi:hypothetical protein
MQVYVRMYVFMCVYEYVYMYVPLASTRTVRRILFLFGISFTIDRCLMSMNILAPKTGTLQMGPQKQNGDFLEKGSNDTY